MVGIRIGCGYDIHRFAGHRNDGREVGSLEGLYLGGILIKDHKGVVAHSDGDVVLHSLIDAILGGSGLLDIGELFPDNNLEETKGISSLKMLMEAYNAVKKKGYVLVNADVIIVTQSPKIINYKQEMITVIAKTLGVETSAINIKGKTKEGVDAVGSGQAIECFSVCLLMECVECDQK